MELRRLPRFLFALALLVASCPAVWSAARSRTMEQPPSAVQSGNTSRTPRAEVTGLPSVVLSAFVENAGQYDPQVRFQAVGNGASLSLTENAMWLSLTRPSRASVGLGASRELFNRSAESAAAELRGVSLKVTFVGANPHPALVGFNRQDTLVSYLTGDAPSEWHIGVAAWAGVRYKDLYPGIDLEVSSENGQLMLRAAMAPDSDSSAVRLRLDGATGVQTDTDHLLVGTTLGDLALPLLSVEQFDVSAEPCIYQRGEGSFEILSPFTDRVPSGSDAHLAEGSFSLLYSTFLGTVGEPWPDPVAQSAVVAVDGSGAAYVAGETYSSGFPTTPGSFDPSHGGGLDVFVAKLNPNGTALVYSTLLGGSGDDRSYDIAVDASGAAYVVGSGSSDFPTTPGAYATGSGAFVAKLNPSGSDLVYSTSLGGGTGFSIAIGDDNSAYVAGRAGSGFPTTVGAYDSTYNGGTADFFITKLNPSGSDLVYSTFLGGSDFDEALGVAVDPTGSAYVAGWTRSTTFPTTTGAFDRTRDGESDAVVAKLNPSGTDLEYCTLLGGSYNDGVDSYFGGGVAANSAGEAYVSGYTSSFDFPTTPGAFCRTYAGEDEWDLDTFVTKLNSNGTGLVYSTFMGWQYLGQRVCSWPGAIDVDQRGSAYITGSAGPGYAMAFVAKLNEAGTDLVFRQWLGGSWCWSVAFGIAVDTGGDAYVTGHTECSGFPTTPGAFDRTYNGGYDIFVAKVFGWRRQVVLPLALRLY